MTVTNTERLKNIPGARPQLPGPSDEEKILSQVYGLGAEAEKEQFWLANAMPFRNGRLLASLSIASTSRRLPIELVPQAPLKGVEKARIGGPYGVPIFNLYSFADAVETLDWEATLGAGNLGIEPWMTFYHSGNHPKNGQYTDFLTMVYRHIKQPGEKKDMQPLGSVAWTVPAADLAAGITHAAVKSDARLRRDWWPGSPTPMESFSIALGIGKRVINVHARDDFIGEAGRHTVAISYATIRNGGRVSILENVSLESLPLLVNTSNPAQKANWQPV